MRSYFIIIIIIIIGLIIAKDLAREADLGIDGWMMYGRICKSVVLGIGNRRLRTEMIGGGS